jgi:chemotaxis-related protein WspD
MSDAPRNASRLVNDCWNQIGVWGSGECAELTKHVHCRNCPVYSAAATQLLDGDLPVRYREDWSVHFAKAKTVTEPGITSAVLFRIHGEWLALAIAVIKEVASVRPVHSLPHRRDRVVRGVANIRGELVVCVSLGEALGIEAGGDTSGPTRGGRERLLVAERDGSRLVFQVDEVQGIRRYHPRELKPPPATVARATATYTRGVLAWEGHSVGCLDEELLFFTLNRSLA